MIYILVFVFVCFFSLVTKKSTVNKLISLIYIVLVFFSGFRFGTGDYYAYSYFYYTFPDTISAYIDNYIKYPLLEPGYSLLMILFKSLGLSFSVFVFFCSFVTVSLYIHTIRKYSTDKVFSVLFLLGNYYIVYIESAIRQGLAMAIFIYAFYDFIAHKKNLRYCLLILIGTTFHISVIITLIVPVIIKIDKKLFRNIIAIVSLTMFMFLCSYFMPKLLVGIGSIVWAKWANTNGAYNIYAVGLRILELIIVSILYKKTYRQLSNYEILSMKIFVFGILFYCMVSSISLLSRLTDYFQCIEIILIPTLIRILRKHESGIYRSFFTIVLVFLLIKDMYGYMSFPTYKPGSVLDYQYITIFNKEKIRTFRDVPVSFEKSLFQDDK